MKRRTRRQRGGLFAFSDVKSESEKSEGEGRGWIYNSTLANERIYAKEKMKHCKKYDCDSLYKVEKFNELDVKLTQFINNVKTNLLPYLKTLRQLVRDDLTDYSKPKPTGGRRTQVRRRR